MPFIRTLLLVLVAFLAPVAATIAYHSMSATDNSQPGVPAPLVGKVLFFTSPG